MSERPPRSEHYKRTREEFDDLEIEDKAVFLLEATVTTLARGVESVGRALADQLDRAFAAARNPRWPGAEEGPTAPPPESGADPGSPAGPAPDAGAEPTEPGAKGTSRKTRPGTTTGEPDEETLL